MKIILAVDGSIHSDYATDSVLKQPWPEGSECRVILVVEPMHASVDRMFGAFGEMASEAQKAFNADIQKVLPEATEKLEANFGKGKVSATFAEGVAYERILEAAHNWPADIIVMGSSGIFGCDHHTSGRVVRAVMNHAPCSVRIVNPVMSNSLEKEIQEHHPLDVAQRFLIAISESHNSQAIIDSVLSRIWPPESLFQVISVVQEPKSVFHSRYIKDPRIDAFHKELYAHDKQEAEKLIANTVSKLETKLGKGKITGHVLEGNVRSLIVQIAEDWPADMIIMGAHDRDKSVLEHFLGSVAQAVVSNADCSIELVR